MYYDKDNPSKSAPARRMELADADSEGHFITDSGDRSVSAKHSCGMKDYFSLANAAGVAKWSEDRVGRWMEEYLPDRVAKVLGEKGLGGEQLKDLNSDMLKEFGVEESDIETVLKEKTMKKTRGSELQLLVTPFSPGWSTTCLLYGSNSSLGLPRSRRVSLESCGGVYSPTTLAREETLS